VILIKNIYTLWGRKRFLLPVTYFPTNLVYPFTLRVTGIKIIELNRQLYADKTTPVPWYENVEIKKELENTYRELDAYINKTNMKEAKKPKCPADC